MPAQDRAGTPVLRVNPISVLLRGVTRRIMDFNTGKQNNPVELPPNRGGYIPLLS